MGFRRRNIRTRKIVTRAIVFLLLGAIVNMTVAWGCARTPLTTSVVEQIHYEMSIGELQIAIAATGRSTPLRHFWTVAHDGHEVMLTSAHVDRVSAFCFLFIDQRLGAILIPANFGRTRPIEDSVSAAMAADALTIEEVRTRCERQLVAYQHAQEHMEFNIALAPLLLFRLFDRTKSNGRKYMRLAHQFDGTRVRLGMTQADTDALFGSPSKLSRTTTHQIVRYGREVDLGLFPVPLVSVAFADAIAVRVQTDVYVPTLNRDFSGPD